MRGHAPRSTPSATGTTSDLADEATYDRVRLGQWLAGAARVDGFSRRDLARLTAAVSVAAGLGVVTGPTLDPTPAAGAGPVPPAGPILKPLPPELFTVYGTNAEMRWEAMRGQG